MPSRLLVALSLWGSFATSPLFADGGDFPSQELPDDKDSIIGENDLEPIESVKGTVFYDMARPVARVENFSRDGFCTAFRVGLDLFMTNYHCWESAGCRVRFRLGYERGLGEDYHALYECTGVVARAQELDFVVYRARPLYPHQLEYPVATLSAKPLALGQELIAPSHPVLQTKHVDVSSECRVTRADPYVYEGVLSMQHQCDTQGGSSGLPLMDKVSGHVVALHWGAAGRTGSNHGVPMALVLERIADIDPDVYAQLLISGQQ